MGSQTAGSPLVTAVAPRQRFVTCRSPTYSRFVQRIRRRYAGELALLPPGLPDRATIAALVERLQADGASLAAALRIARQLMLERLAVLDVEEGAPLADITRAMTELAEATLELALARTLADQDARFGVPRDDAGERIDFWIVGMGKLGARELNVSSDIDLVYVYEGDGQTDGARPVSAHEYFSQVARGLYALIGDVTEDGFVFRVDLALRPNGNSGPPVTQPGDARGLPAGARPRVGALRLAEEPRRRAARERRQRPRARAQVARHRLRLSPLPRLRRLRGPAPAARQGARRGAAARRRPARARQRRQALARRHPRDRVHRPAAAGRSRRPVPRDPHPLDAEGARQARRRRPDEARRPARAWPTPTRCCAASSTASSTSTTSRRTSCRPTTPTSTGSRAASATAARTARAQLLDLLGVARECVAARVRPAAARRPRAGSSNGCRTCGPAPLPVDAEAFLAAAAGRARARASRRSASSRRSGCCATRARCASAA